MRPRPKAAWTNLTQVLTALRSIIRKPRVPDQGISARSACGVLGRVQDRASEGVGTEWLSCPRLGQK